MKIKRTLFTTTLELTIEELQYIKNNDPGVIRGILSTLSGQKWGYTPSKKGGRIKK